MKRLTIALATALALLLFAAPVLATTYHTITVDGDLSDWDLDEWMEQDNGSDLYLTWDNTNLYLGLSGVYLGDTSGQDHSFFVCFDTDLTPGSGAASDGYGRVNFDTAVFAPEYCYYFAGGGGWYEWSSWDGSAWVWPGWRDDGSFYDYPGNPAPMPGSELTIIRSDIGDPSAVAVAAWLTQEGDPNLTASWPTPNAVGASPTFAHFYHYPSLVGGISPGGSVLADHLLINEVVPKGTEWIELYNPLTTTLDLTGWYLTDGEGTDTLGGTIAPGAYLVTPTANIGLSNDGDEVMLYAPGDVLIDMMAFGTNGSAPIAPTGDSTARSPNGADSDDDGRDWNLDDTPTSGSPNDAPGVSLGSSLIINELSNYSPPADDALEFYNPLTTSLPITGWLISDGDGWGTILTTTSVPAGGWLVIDPNDYGVYFTGSDVGYLFQPDGTRVDQIGWDGDFEDDTFQRIPDGAGPHDGYDWASSGGGAWWFDLPDTLGYSNVVSTNLAVAKTGPASALAGGDIVYSLHFSATNPAPAVWGYVWDMLPAEVNFVDYALSPMASHTFTQTGGDLEWLFADNLVNGIDYTLQVTGSVGLNASGTITNQVLVDAFYNITPTDDYDLWTTDILQAGINFTKTVGTDPGVCATTSVITLPIGGGDVYYCYAVRNSGQVTLSLHDLEDDQLGTIFTGLPYSLTPSLSTYLTIPTLITQTTANTAIWTAYNAGPSDVVSDTDDATVFVEGLAPDLYVAKTVTPTEAFVREGEPALLTYTIHITNAGNQQANNVELVDTPPFGFAYVTDTSGVTPTMMGDNIVWNLGNLTSTPGSNAISFQLWMSATDAITLTGPYFNVATVTADNDPIGDFSAASVQINRVLSIYDIQYVDDPFASDASPWEGEHVWVEGVATTNSDDFDGIRYFIEDPAGGPWSGLYVYHNGDRGPVQEGDWLLLYGLVQEYFGLTELDLRNSAGGEQTILSSNNPLPPPEMLTTETYGPTAVGTAEAYEGVLLEFQAATVVSDDLGFGEWSFDDGSGEAHADDLSSSLVYTPTIGDYYLYIRGVGYYSFSEYKLAPRYNPDIAFPFTLTLAYHDLEDVVGTGEAIYLAGDFNGWDSLALPMIPDAGYETFSASLYITEPATYNYKYIVYTDTAPSGPANWNWLQSDNRSVTPEVPDVVHDYRAVQPGYVVLQGPTATTTMVGQPTEDILGQIWADDLTSRPGPPRALLAELGYGQDPNPATWTTWGAMAWSGQEGNNDQFSGVMTPTMAGVYSYVVRFNPNWGLGNPNDAWTYGDSDGVHPGDPFEIGNAGLLTVTAPVTGPILSLSKSVDDGLPIGDEPDLGEPVTYTIILANDGNVDAQNVHAWDVPADPDCINLQALDWTGTVAAHESITFTIPATVANDPACYGVRVDNTAYYSHTSGSGEDSAYFYVAEPNFILTKNADPDTNVPYHGTVTYTIQLRNYGTTDAQDTWFTDTLPISVTFARWIDYPAGTTVVDDQITWHGTLTEDARIYVTFIVTHVGDYGETVRNTAELSHTTLSQVRTAYDDFTVESPTVSPSLSIDKLVYPNTDVAYHGEVTFTLALINSGVGDAQGVTLTDSLPAEVTFARWSNQPPNASVLSDVVSWSGTVSGTDAIAFTFVVTHVGDYGETVTNTAEYRYGQESDTASASFSVREAGPAPQLSVDKQVSPSTNVPLNSSLIYTISLSNSGDAAALGVVLTDVLPAEVSFGGWLVQNGADETDGTITWSGDISPTMDASLVFSATLVSGDPGANVSNLAQYASDNAGSGSDEAVLSIESEISYTIYLPIVLKNSQ